MIQFTRTFGLVTLGGLAAIGLIALAGLVSPVANDYLAATMPNGDAAITRTTPALVRVHLTPPDTARLTVMRNGKPTTLLFDLDPDCPPPTGWV